MTKLTLILKLATNGVLANKVRSVLTVLGIVIGIAAVIALLALGSGAQKSVLSSVNSLGSDLITITPGSTDDFRGPQGVFGRPGIKDLTFRELDFLSNERRFPFIKYVSPVISGTLTVSNTNSDLNTRILGVSYNYQELQDNLNIDVGRFFNKSEVEGSSKVIVIGLDAAKELFPKIEKNKDIIGEQLSINSETFRVVGVLKSRGSSGFVNLNNDIFMPYSAAGSYIFDTDAFNSISLKVTSTATLNTTIKQINDKLAVFRGSSQDKTDFTIFTSEDLLTTAATVTGIFTSLLASIAAISLVVGGIGISNIMLVSVTERTKEIGLRKAIGAKRNDILLQFLTESIFLTLIGGIIGIILGITLAFVLGNATNITPELSIEAILLATGVSASIGLIFGFFPALRAASLDPIEALRYE